MRPDLPDKLASAKEGILDTDDLRHRAVAVRYALDKPDQLLMARDLALYLRAAAEEIDRLRALQKGHGHG